MSVLNNISIPKIGEEDLSNAQSVKAILNYLALLDKQLKYALYNLDPEDNFSEKALGTYNEVVGTGSGGESLRTLIEQTAEAVRIEAERASTEEGRLSSSITTTAEGIRSEVNAVIGEGGTLSTKVEQTAQGLSSKVSQGSVISSINQEAGSVKIKAEKINLNGAVTANDNFKINVDGSIEGKSATFTNTDENGKTSSITIDPVDGIKVDGIKANSDGAFVLGSGGAIASGQVNHQVLQCIANSANVILSAPLGILYLGYGDGNIPATTQIIAWEQMVNAAGAQFLTSDRREKKSIEEIPEEKSMETIKKLKPVSFMYQNSNDKNHGFIAQDVLEENLDFKSVTEYEKPNGEERLALSYESFIADLVGSVKYLCNKVEILEKEIESLKGDNDGNISD